MKVYFDGQIFDRQRVGGAARMWAEILKEFIINERYDLEMVIACNGDRNLYFKDIKNSSRKLRYKKERFYRPGRFWHRFKVRQYKLMINRPWRDEQFIFNSTYFSCLNDSKAVNVVPLYDMIFELFPQYFRGSSEQRLITEKKECLHKADRIIAISSNTKNDLLRIYPQIKPEKVEVVHLAVNKEDFMFEKDPPPIDRPYFLYVGNHDAYKDFKTLLNAFATLPEKEHFLICIGGGNFSPDELGLISKLGLDKRIKHFSGLSDSELGRYYHFAAAFVFPSLYEGFGIPILEAMACECPVICSRSSSFPEVAGDAAFYFEPGQAEDLVECMKQVQSESVRKNAIMNGFINLEKFSWDASARKLYECYQNLTQK